VNARDWDWEAARRRCLREARRVLCNRDDAEEAVQEALLRAWRAGRAGWVPEHREAWLTTIARNEAYRVGDRRRRAADRERAQPPPEARDAIAALVDTIAFEQVLSALGPGEREVVSLRYGGDLTQAQVAHYLNLPLGTVKIRLHRGRNRLRSVMMEGSR
jgi:RNA polymerase sigma-70 factor (ECF subfamily)